MRADNRSANLITQGLGNSDKRKHIDIKHAYCKEQVAAGVIVLDWIASEMNEADLLTKALDHRKFAPLRDGLMASRTSSEASANTAVADSRGDNSASAPVCSEPAVNGQNPVGVSLSGAVSSGYGGSMAAALSDAPQRAAEGSAPSGGAAMKAGTQPRVQHRRDLPRHWMKCQANPCVGYHASGMIPESNGDHCCSDEGDVEECIWPAWSYGNGPYGQLCADCADERQRQDAYGDDPPRRRNSNRGGGRLPELERLGYRGSASASDTVEYSVYPWYGAYVGSLVGAAADIGGHRLWAEPGPQPPPAS